MTMNEGNPVKHPELKELVQYYYDALDDGRAGALKAHVLSCGECGGVLAELAEAEEYSLKDVLGDPMFLEAEQFVKQRIAESSAQTAARMIVGLVITTKLFTLARSAARFSGSEEKIEHDFDIGGGAARLWATARRELMLTLTFERAFVEERGEPSPVYCSLRQDGDEEEIPLCFVLPVRQKDTWAGTSPCGPREALAPLDRERRLHLVFDPVEFGGLYREPLLRSVRYAREGGGRILGIWCSWLAGALEKAQRGDDRSVLEEALALLAKG